MGISYNARSIQKMPIIKMWNATQMPEYDVWFQGRSGISPKRCVDVSIEYTLCDTCATLPGLRRGQLWRGKRNQINCYWKFKILTHIDVTHANVMVKINILSKPIGLWSTTWQQTGCNVVICLRNTSCHIVLGHIAHSFPTPYFVIWPAYWRQCCLSELLHDLSKDSRNKITLEMKLKIIQPSEQWSDRQPSKHISLFNWFFGSQYEKFTKCKALSRP